MTMLNGILYAIYKGADVINISMGAILDDAVKKMPVSDQLQASRQNGLEEQDVWDYITKLADRRNVTLVWAAGNDDVLTQLDPSKRCDCAVRVSAVDQNLAKAGFSNYGNLKEYKAEASTVSAPGVGIFGAKPYNAYDAGPGTSFAAPIVTGAIALMKSLDKTISNKEIIAILRETGRQPSDGCTSIGPVIQIKDALLRVQKDFVRYDDIIKDHTKLQGLWQSTELLKAYSHDGTPTGELVRVYFKFDTLSSGASTVYESGSKKDYTASVTVDWSKGLAFATTEYKGSGIGYDPISIRCKPDKSGLLQCFFSDNKARTSRKPFYLKKIKKRKD